MLCLYCLTIASLVLHVCVSYFTLCFKAKPTCNWLLRETKAFHFMCVLLKLLSISHTDCNKRAVFFLSFKSE